MSQRIAHFNLLERIGEGGLGEVYRARDTKVGRTVALKLPPPALLADPARRERFLEDTRAAAALSHPNIATLFDVGEQEGRWYLAYEFASGTTLRQQIGGRPMQARHAIELAIQIADALSEAHSRGVMHTDLRPETIVITPKGSSKILDFGMAAWTRGGIARARAATNPDALDKETPRVAAYLSPEQALGEAVDPRTDIFTLAVIVYEMVSGRNPFGAPSGSATLMNVIRKQPPSLLKSHPELPTELDAMLSRALTKDLAARQQSAASFAAELRSLAAILDVRSGDVATGELLRLDDEGNESARWWWVGALLAVGAIAIVWWMVR